MKTRLSLTILTLLVCGLAGTSYPNGLIVNPYIFKSATPSPTPADTSPPVLVSATVDQSGLVLTLIFSEAVTADDWSKTRFLMLHYSTAYNSGDAVDTVMFDITDGPVNPKDDELLSYDGSGTVHDIAGNSLVPFTDFALTNNTK
jgi:hypothetical protein